MKVSAAAFLLCLPLFASCATHELNHNESYIVNNELFLAYKDIDKSLNIERTELLFSNGNAAKNCSTYFDLVSRYEVDESVNNMAVKSEYLICDALEILSKKSVGTIRKTADFRFGEELSSRLDLRTFPSSLFNASDDKKYNLQSMYSKNVTSKGSVTVAETPDWIFRLEVVAVTQVNNNETPDWIVWLTDESKSGNYRAYKTLVIYDPTNQPNYSAVPYH